MKILALDASTAACSVALSIDDKITEEFRLAPQQQANLLLPFIDHVLTKNQVRLTQLDAIAYGAGPGSFTGLRIAAGVVQGLAYSASLPVVPISTLQAIAQAAFNQHKSQQVIVCLDARMHEVYCGWYNNMQPVCQALAEDKVCSPQAIYQASVPDWLAIGPGWEAYADELATACSQPPQTIIKAYPHAAIIAQLAAVKVKQGDTVKAAQALPVYVRNKVT